MKTLQILVSTYNGAKYLREQLDSLLDQNCEQFGRASFSILIRDDGSQDETQHILEEYATKFPQKIRWYQGENVGVVKSFFDLLCQADACDFYAFCDQDDYWMPEKLIRAIDKLEEMNQEKPLLYCCRPKLVDAQLQPIATEIDRSSIRPSFQNALVENVATGCTEVFNQKLHAMLVARQPDFTIMHDWWLYLIATCFGEMYYDETPYICYRQHGGNVLGTKTKRMDELKMRLRRFRSTRGNLSHQVQEFVKLFGDVEQDNPNLEQARQFVQVKDSFFARCRFFKRAGIFRQRKMDHRIFCVILLMGNY